MDTIRVKKGEIFTTRNKSYTFKNDTVLILPSTVHYEVKPSKNDAFFSNLAQRADKNKITRELHNIIITKSKSNGTTDSVKVNNSSLPFIFYAGKPIRNIQIKQLDVFGPTIDDTLRTAQTWMERTSNKLHFRTKEYLIRKNLIFKEGDYIDPITLADNERLLRALPYLEDARIIVKPSNAFSDSTDILIIAKDNWPTAFNIEFENAYSGKFSAWNRNIFGFGQELQNDIPWDSHKSPKIGTDNVYIINNVSGSFITSKIFYNNSFQTRQYGIDLERKFFTPNVKYAGGASLYNERTLSRLPYDTAKTFYNISYNNFDFWLGRSFLIKKDGFGKMRHNLTLSSRLIRSHFYERPMTTSSSYYDYQDKALLLGAITYSRQSFIKSNYIYNFGRTEDIPLGSKIDLIAGREFNEFFDRNYFATSISSGTYIGNFGYLYGSFSAGSFFLLNTQRNEQSILNAELRYFSPLLIINRYKIRQFVSCSYTGGINRFKMEYLSINENSGIAGFRNDSLFGTKRFNMHWETVCFTPLVFYDFHFVFFIYADHSWLAKGSDKIFNKAPYTGIGLGVRIRNERLVFNTIQIAFSLYPNVPKESKTSFLDISGEPLLNPPSYLPQAPGVIPYK
jgi:Outer membrane protein/protective antigen OMA87